MSSAPTGNESIRQGLQQAAATAFQRAQAHVDNGTIPDSQNVRRLLQHAASEAVSLARGFQFPDGIPPSVHDSAHVLEGAFEGLWPILKRCLFLWTVGTTILISSMTMYGIFYVLVQPGQMAREPIYFDYSRLAHHPAPSTCPNETTNQCKLPMLMTDKTINMPWAVADIFSQQSQWEYHIEHVVPKPKTEDRILKQGRSYFIEIYLELPESPVNRDIGIVMVQVDLQSSNGTRLATSVRPCRLPHESQWISTIRKSFWLVPLVIGAAQETRRVIVPSFRHFVESADLPLVSSHPFIATIDYLIATSSYGRIGLSATLLLPWVGIVTELQEGIIWRLQEAKSSSEGNSRIFNFFCGSGSLPAI